MAANVFNVASRITRSLRTAGGVAFAVASVFHPVNAQNGGTAKSPRYETVHRFSLQQGWWPSSGLKIDAAGNFIGINQNGGTSARYSVDQVGCGTLYALNIDQTAKVHSFRPDARGCVPVAELYIDKNGNVYGVTSEGGTFRHGTVYRRGPSGAVRLLHAFNGADGDHANAGLALGKDGSLYGSTSFGGLFGRGTLFKISADGIFSSIYSFKRGDIVGETPTSAMVLAADGNLYGTANYGRRNHGTVFRVSENDQPQLVYAFNGKDGDFPGALMVGADGLLYAGTIAGGQAGVGLLYSMTLKGEMSILHEFNGEDGSNVRSALVQAPDGWLYGTTVSGGSSGTANAGTIFRMNTVGVFEMLKSFVPGTDEGYLAKGPLTVAPDGNLYGTTSWGGNQKLQGYGTGTVFRLVMSD